MNTSKEILWLWFVIILGFKTAFGQELTQTNHLPLKTDRVKLAPPPTLTIKPCGVAAVKMEIPFLVKKTVFVQTGTNAVSAVQTVALSMRPAPVLRPAQK